MNVLERKKNKIPQSQSSTVFVKYRRTCVLNNNVIQIIMQKRYSKKDQHLEWHFKYNGECLLSPPPFLCSQIITPFSNQ